MDRDRALSNAAFAALAPAVAFTATTVLLLVLVVAIPVARPERIGFTACTAAAAVSLWTVWWFIKKATAARQRPHSTRR